MMFLILSMINSIIDVMNETSVTLISCFFSSSSHMTQCTTWMDPRPNHYAAFQSFCATLPLPDGYEQSHDQRGNIYFIDHHNKQTCWDDPRPSKQRYFFSSFSIRSSFRRLLSFDDD